MSSYTLKIIAFSALILLCSSKKTPILRVPWHSGVMDRSNSRMTIGLGVLGYHRWGTRNEFSRKMGGGYENQYPIHYKREEKSEELTPEDLARMPKNYRKIVESGGHLEDFKQYYLSDLYDEDLKEIEEERKRISNFDY